MDANSFRKWATIGWMLTHFESGDGSCIPQFSSIHKLIRIYNLTDLNFLFSYVQCLA